MTENSIHNYSLQPEPSPDMGRIRIELTISPEVNFALQQNRIPILKKLVIHNSTERDLAGLTLTLSSVPELCMPLSQPIERIPAGTSYELRELQPVLNADYLAGVTAKLTGHLSAQLEDAGGVLCTENVEISVLAFDEWPMRHPELLAAFVTPNHPDIAPILGRAAELLGEWTGDPSLSGYIYGGSERALMQAAAIYGALSEQDIVYAVNPASHERGCQHVRTVDIIMAQKLATCLDSTLLYASCCEAIGLNTVLVELNNHIFPGIWLSKNCFPEAVSDDPSIVSKRLPNGINEIAVMESTCITRGRVRSFDKAREAAEVQFTDGSLITHIIDIKRARLSGITPLPMRVKTDNGWEIVREQDETEHSTPESPHDIGETIVIEESDETVHGKQQLWERRLLDLSMRNPLLNMRLTRSVVPLLELPLDTLEDRLADGLEFELHARPAELGAAGSLNPQNMHDCGKYSGLIRSEFENGRLRAAIGEAELAHALKELTRGAKNAIEESGANTLFIALGHLRWYEQKQGKKARCAPLLLLPAELTKKSGSRGYTLRLREDEVQINFTILEKLRQDFDICINGLDKLPMDEHGYDLRRIFTIVRRAVMHMPDWDVLESACIGLFSYAQFVMYNDIRRRADRLDENKIVRSLKEGRLVWEAESPQQHGRVPEDDILLPLPADASQLSAIRAAASGLSFLLEGPPGAGKSQTITNMIVNALAQGRRVLFVSAKKEALDVVHERLEECGAGPFCMEIHSNKTSKKSVLAQLERALEASGSEDYCEYEQRAEQLSALRRTLDGYSTALHAVQPCGMSTYELVNSCEQYRTAAELAPFDADFAPTVDAQSLGRMTEAVEALISAAKAVGHPAESPLSAVSCPRYTQQLRMALTPTVAAYRTAVLRLSEACAGLSAALDLELPLSLADMDALVLTARQLKLWSTFPREWAEAEDFTHYIRGVQELCRRRIRAERLQRELEEDWSADFFSHDGRALAGQFERANSRGVIAKAFGLSSLAGRVVSCAKNAIPATDLGSHFSRLAEYQAELTEAKRLSLDYGAGIVSDGSPGFWNAVLSDAKTAEESAVNLSRLSGGSRLRRECAGVTENEALCDELTEARAAVRAAHDALTQLILIDTDDSADWVAANVELCDVLTEHAGELKAWAAWNAAAESARELGLDPVVDACLTGMAHEDILPAFKRALYTALAVQAIDSSDELGCFSGSVFNDKLAQFERTDAELAELTREEVLCRLAARVPDLMEEAARSPELNLLNKAIRSGGRGMSIRRLFDEIPELMPRLTPCMLMSPLSAAQYLSEDFPLFDLVIFDEASQLPTAQAVGALSRGREAVIVGDPKQLPPTNFFTPENSREDELAYEDLESILDDCLALNMPMARLLWHYRSRHESLIAFSNRRFYGNRLRTFASVNDRETRVHLVPIAGSFDHGGSRVNRAEAEAVVMELRRRCHDREAAKMSHGVVTFNLAQQELIEDLLAEACAEDPKLDAWVNSAKEPVFVKTLERVQGSERDVILFSVAYAPDPSGRFHMNFGPLNRDGGWRRLNVAVTRARQEMLVFSSIKPEQIDLSRTSSEGVAALRAFLEYASGRRLPEDKNSVRRRKPDSEGVAEAICSELHKHGYRTQRSVGRSEHRIDIAVIDPKDSGRYILGILLDGESYGSARTTRDRELAQLSVLRGLGWRIHRIWAMDWWDSSRRELERILSLLSEVTAA